MIVLLLGACGGADDPPPAVVAPPAVEPAAPSGPPPSPLLGAAEVPTPPALVRATGVKTEQAPRRLDVWFEADVTTFGDFRKQLETWGFSVLDGDGESLRVVAPAGGWWPERMAGAAGVRRVAYALDQEVLPSGAMREGTATFGAATWSFSLRDAKVKATLTGATTPRDPLMPRALPVAVVRCLAPLRAELMDGHSQGPNWERALQPEPPAWALVLNHYGPCDATGWMALRPDAPIDTLTVGGRPAGKADDRSVAETSITYLSSPRSEFDDGAGAATDVLRKAPDELVIAAIRKAAPGPARTKLWEEYARRDETAAMQLALSEPGLRALAAALDAPTREAIVVDEKATSAEKVAALAVWRPERPEGLARFKADRDPAVREAAWAAAIDVTESACLARVQGARTLDLAGASALYRECPQQPARSAAFARLCTLDKNAAAGLVSETLSAPETTRSGVSAIRFANALERDDLLEKLVADVNVSRDVRLEALRTLLRVGRSSKSGVLLETHGAYLGLRQKPPAAVATP